MVKKERELAKQFMAKVKATELIVSERQINKYKGEEGEEKRLREGGE